MTFIQTPTQVSDKAPPTPRLVSRWGRPVRGCDWVSPLQARTGPPPPSSCTRARQRNGRLPVRGDTHPASLPALCFTGSLHAHTQFGEEPFHGSRHWPLFPTGHQGTAHTGKRPQPRFCSSSAHFPLSAAETGPVNRQHTHICSFSRD